MEYVIQIRCDNDAFKVDPHKEVNEMLSDIIGEQDNGLIDQNLRDTKGRMVGTLRVYHDRKPLEAVVLCPECGYEIKTMIVPGFLQTIYCPGCRLPLQI